MQRHLIKRFKNDALLERISGSWSQNQYSLYAQCCFSSAISFWRSETTFIDNTPELFEFPRIRDRGNKTMKYIGEITINGFPGIEKQKTIL